MISETIIRVMREIQAVKKDRRNTSQGFQFRGIDDVYNELHAIFAKHGLFTIPRVIEESSLERTTKSGGMLIHRVLKVEFDFVDSTGEKLTVGPIIGEAMDSGDKAANKALSIAHKYALLQVFLIPTVEKKDPDEDGYEPLSAHVPREIGPPPIKTDIIEVIEEYSLPLDRVEAWTRKKWGLELNELSETQKSTVVAKLPAFADALMKEITERAAGAGEDHE